VDRRAPPGAVGALTPPSESESAAAAAATSLYRLWTHRRRSGIFLSSASKRAEKRAEEIIGCVVGGGPGDQYARLSAMISSTRANDQQSETARQVAAAKVLGGYRLPDPNQVADFQPTSPPDDHTVWFRAPSRSYS